MAIKTHPFVYSSWLQSYANTLASACKFEHSGTRGVGENLYWFSGQSASYSAVSRVTRLICSLHLCTLDQNPWPKKGLTDWWCMTPLYCPHLKAINGWYNEVKDYKFTARPWSDNQANFAKIGHFTQLVSACQAGLERPHHAADLQCTAAGMERHHDARLWKGYITLWHLHCLPIQGSRQYCWWLSF